MGKGKGKQKCNGTQASAASPRPRKEGRGHNRKARKGATKRRPPADAVDDGEFRRKLRDDGYSVKDMAGDGNCLFRALADQLHEDAGATHDVVRHDICRYLAQHREEFQCFLLLDDEDEDVADMDAYISSMQEDGEWGGNVEIVCASRVWKRNIIAFSGEYADGALSIACDEREDGAPDLLLSYHGNDHYNSVHPVHGRPHGPAAPTRAPAAQGQQKEGGPVEGGARTPPRRAETLAATGRTRPPTRGGACPCGSGLKYKKCCLAKEKADRRLAKHKAKYGAEVELVGHASLDSNTTVGDEKKEDGAFIGTFKVLSI